MEFLIYLTFIGETTSVILLLALCAGEGDSDVSDIYFGSTGDLYREAFFKLCILCNVSQCRKKITSI